MRKNYLFLLLLTLIFASNQLSARCGDCKCTRSNWDYIIIGCGTAGATLARELSDNRHHRVLVLEWGENRSDDTEVLSPDVFAYANQLTYDPLYAINQIVQLNFSTQPQPQFFIYSDGRMWGGSSAHNGLFAVRGTPRVYNEWATISGQQRWNYNNLLTYFLETEHYTPNGTIPNSAQRGLSGNLYITQRPPVNNDAFANALSTATGAPLISDYNDPSLGDIGTSARQEYITPAPNSYRSFSVNAFTPVGSIVSEDGFGLDGRKLRIVSNALVNRVVFNGNHAVGVEYYLDGNENRAIYVKAKKKIIICAGACWTPALLERSGIGDRSLLNSLRIPVVFDNPNVGEHLYNHYGVNGLISGSMSITPFIDAFTDNRPYEPSDGSRRIVISARHIPNTGIAVSSLLLKPKSKGSVHIVDTNPTVYPRLNLNMFSDGSVSTQGTDSYEIVSFLKVLQLIAAAYSQTVVSPSSTVYNAGDNALLAYAQTLSNMNVAYHVVGTARMGQSSSDSVVDGNLHVFGVRNLMVADVSIEPVIEDGPTAYAAYFIGRAAADIIKHGH